MKLGRYELCVDSGLGLVHPLPHLSVWDYSPKKRAKNGCFGIISPPGGDQNPLNIVLRDHSSHHVELGEAGCSGFQESGPDRNKLICGTLALPIPRLPLLSLRINKYK